MASEGVFLVSPFLALRSLLSFRVQNCVKRGGRLRLLSLAEGELKGVAMWSWISDVGRGEDLISSVMLAPSWVDDLTWPNPSSRMSLILMRICTAATLAVIGSRTRHVSRSLLEASMVLYVVHQTAHRRSRSGFQLCNVYQLAGAGWNSGKRSTPAQRKFNTRWRLHACAFLNRELWREQCRLRSLPRSCRPTFRLRRAMVCISSHNSETTLANHLLHAAWS